MKGSIFFQGGGHEKQIAIILNMDIYNMGYQSCHTFLLLYTFVESLMHFFFSKVPV